MILGNVFFFFVSITRNRNEFHPVQQSGGHSGDGIRGRYEEYLAQIERDIQVMISEC